MTSHMIATMTRSRFAISYVTIDIFDIGEPGTVELLSLLVSETMSS